MKIIAHRGLWDAEVSGNTLEAFEKAFQSNMGIETDIRDYCGKLVVSHNIAGQENFEFDRVLEMYHEMKCSFPLAINIKADGLQKLLKSSLEKYKIESYFVFDMSVPEQVVFLRQKFHTFARMSEYEQPPILVEQSDGIWMDEWQESWIDAKTIRTYRRQGKMIAVISPEIHGRENKILWEQLREFSDDDMVMLCTDVAKEAEEYFNEWKN